MVRSLGDPRELPGYDGKRKRIAVIGLGMAGATAAHLLATKHDVVGIEALPEAGLHYHSIADGDISFDMPLRAMSPHYYPNLFRWYACLGVGMSTVNYQSTGSDAESQSPYFQYSNFVVFGRALSWPRLARSNWYQTIVIVWNYIWLVFASVFLLATDRSDRLSHETMGQYLQRHRYAAVFVDRFFLPVMSTLLSCSYEQVLGYPAELILSFFCSRATTFFTGWFRLQQGVRAVSDRLLANVTCRYNCPVDRIERINLRDPSSAAVRLHFRKPSSPSASVQPNGPDFEDFDYVVLATDAPVARKMLADASKDEAALLESVSTFAARIVAHTDETLMPLDRTAWSGLNYFSNAVDPLAARQESPAKSPAPRNASMTTACMTRFGMQRVKGAGSATASNAASAEPSPPHSPTRRSVGDACGDFSGSSELPTAEPSLHTSESSAAPARAAAVAEVDGPATASTESMQVVRTEDGRIVFQTWNPYRSPRDGALIRESYMGRAVWTVDGLASFHDALSRGVQGSRRVWFAGSYASRGVTLLEQACTSGLDVAEDFGVKLPFPVQRRPQYFLPFVLIGAGLNAVAAVAAMWRALIAFLVQLFWISSPARRRD